MGDPLNSILVMMALEPAFLGKGKKAMVAAVCRINELPTHANDGRYCDSLIEVDQGKSDMPPPRN